MIYLLHFDCHMYLNYYYLNNNLLRFSNVVAVISFVVLKSLHLNGFEHNIKNVRTIEEMVIDYESDKNSMIAVSETEDVDTYGEFYDEFDNRIRLEQTMNVIFFGPSSSFMRLDPETILHLIAHTKKHLIPISKAILAWDILTDGKTAAFLQGREYLALGSLLNVIPEEELYYVNFGDLSVLKFFATHELDLHKRKYGILSAAYRRYFGNRWYDNSSFINDLGYLLCGFTSNDLEHISPKTFKELSTDSLERLTKCNFNQTKTLYNIATHPEAYGEPHKWSSHEINRLGMLTMCIPKQDLSSVSLEAITAISPKVMKSMNQEKLEYFTKYQIMRMNPKTRRIYILRMQLKSSLDMSQIAKRGVGLIECYVPLIFANMVIVLKTYNII